MLLHQRVEGERDTKLNTNKLFQPNQLSSGIGKRRVLRNNARSSNNGLLLRTPRNYVGTKIK
jgi:hypothetical protein